jgi:hypothetical protein
VNLFNSFLFSSSGFACRCFDHFLLLLGLFPHFGQFLVRIHLVERVLFRLAVFLLNITIILDWVFFDFLNAVLLKVFASVSTAVFAPLWSTVGDLVLNVKKYSN